MNKLRDLDSTLPEVVEDIKVHLKEQFNSSKETWLMKGVYDYYLMSNSSKAVDVIVSVKEPHDGHFLDRIADGMKSTNRLQHLTLLGHVVRRKPIWLFKISKHTVFQELLRLLKTETDIVTVVSALLIINILLPYIPGFLAKHLPQIFNVFSKLAAMNATSNNYHDASLIHLQISLYTLFHRLYGMFPCNFLTFLRKEFSSTDKFPVFSHTVKPMLESVRMNPLLITSNAEYEIQNERWKNVEPHDIIISCAKLLSTCDSNTPVSDYKSTFDCKHLIGAVKVSGTQTVSDYYGDASKSLEDVSVWSPSTRSSGVPHHIESTPTMIPLTPISRGFEVSSPYSEHEGSSPPEAAIEATPETTPSRDYQEITRPPLRLTAANRSLESFTKGCPAQGSKVPIPDRSFPSSPIKKDVPQFRFYPSDAFPNAQPATEKPMNKFERLKTDRNQAIDGAIEVTSVGPVGNDLSSNLHHDGNHAMISTQKAITSKAYTEQSSSALNVTRARTDRREINGLASKVQMDEGKFSNDFRVPDAVENNILSPEACDEYEECELEKSGSPCTSGGLHMPDSRCMQKFARMIRTRYYSQTYSESGGCSSGTSPQEIGSFLPDSKVRRTHSCPEMKKSSPSSMFSFGHADKLSLPEEKEEDEDDEGDSHSGDLDENHIAERREMVSCAIQTDELPPLNFPYEHLFMDMFPPLQPSASEAAQSELENSASDKAVFVNERIPTPSNVLLKYVDAAIYCHNEKGPISGYSHDSKFLPNQLKLMSFQLLFEEHRREIHAERNRRLLGRSRRNKTLEEHNSALKDQVLLQQKDLEDSSKYWQKIVAVKQSELEDQHNSAEHWKLLYHELEVKYKKIHDGCLEIDTQLKDERKTNKSYNTKINEGKSALIDVTNELRVNQKEARVAKELRSKVAELQSEILKAGETIIRYHRRLTELIRPSPESMQHEILRAAYHGEVNRLKNALRVQSLSLDSSRAVIAGLKEDIRNKENGSRNLVQSVSSSQTPQKQQLQDLEKNHAELKRLYNREVERVQELEFKIDFAKRVNRFQAPPRPIAEFLGSKGYVMGGASNAAAADTSDSSSAPAENASKLTKMTENVRAKPAKSSALVKSESAVPDGDQPRASSLNQSNAAESGISDSSKLWKRGRNECAESGQLRSSVQSDAADGSSGGRKSAAE